MTASASSSPTRQFNRIQGVLLDVIDVFAAAPETKAAAAVLRKSVKVLRYPKAPNGKASTA